MRAAINPHQNMFRIISVIFFRFYSILVCQWPILFWLLVDVYLFLVFHRTLFISLFHSARNFLQPIWLTYKKESNHVGVSKKKKKSDDMPLH
jgi:hypothetical protein